MDYSICEQRQRLLDTPGHLLVRGGAGSGKTTIALLKAGREIQEGRLGPEQTALFLSFARATVARVAEQAVATLPREQRRQVEINTYHGFAWSVLRSHGYLLSSRPGVGLLLPAQARARLSGLTGQARKARELEIFEQEGLLSFDLFPLLVTRLLARSATLAQAYARAYPLIIVDEFQDTNSDQWEMIKVLGRHSTIMALGDAKQRIYEFTGADPKRFDEFIAEYKPAIFDFASENRRSPGTDIPAFGDDLLAGQFSAQQYAGVHFDVYQGQGLRALKAEALAAAKRLGKGGGEWSLAILVPANVLAVSVFDYMGSDAQGLPAYPADIVVSPEGPALAAHVIALLLEPVTDPAERAVQFLRAVAEFHRGRADPAPAVATNAAAAMEAMATAVQVAGLGELQRRVLGRDVASLLEESAALNLVGDPVRDWLSVRRLLGRYERRELAPLGKDARYMRLLRRGAQIEARLAESWRQNGEYRGAREMLALALQEDQFAATTRPHLGVTVMTIHRAKGKEFDEVLVFEGPYHRFHRGTGAAEVRAARANVHVAVTRARKRVTLYTPRGKVSPLLTA